MFVWTRLQSYKTSAQEKPKNNSSHHAQKYILIFQISLNIEILEYSFPFLFLPMIIKSKTPPSKLRFQSFLFLNSCQIIPYPTMSYLKHGSYSKKTPKILLFHILPIVSLFRLSQTIHSSPFSPIVNFTMLHHIHLAINIPSYPLPLHTLNTLSQGKHPTHSVTPLCRLHA
jgi:hypothetical protein